MNVYKSLNYPCFGFKTLTFFPKDTMAIKKRSSRTRRIRPVSSRLSEWPSAGSSSRWGVGRASRTREPELPLKSFFGFRWRGQPLPNPSGSPTPGSSHPLGLVGVFVHPAHQRLPLDPRDPRQAPPTPEAPSGTPPPRICEFCVCCCAVVVINGPIIDPVHRIHESTLLIEAQLLISDWKWIKFRVCLVTSISLFLCFV